MFLWPSGGLLEHFGRPAAKGRMSAAGLRMESNITRMFVIKMSTQEVLNFFQVPLNLFFLLFIVFNLSDCVNHG